MCSRNDAPLWVRYERFKGFRQLHVFVVLLATISICCCTNVLSDSGKRPAQVTLIFNGAPRLSDTIFINERTIFTGGVSIALWENLSFEPIRPVWGKLDTISIPINSAKVKLRHRYRELFYSDIILYPGDTLDVSYQNANPVFQVRNRDVHAYDLSIDSLLYESLYAENKFPALLFYQTYPMLKNLKSNNTSMMFDVSEKDKWEKRALDEMENERSFLDSLLHNELISQDVYEMRKDRIVFQRYVLDYSNGRMTDANVKSIVDSVRTVGIGLPYTYFVELSQLFLDRQYSTEVPLLYDAVKPVPKDSGNYARLEGSDVFPVRVKELLLYKQVRSAAQHLPLEAFRSTFQKFSSYSADTSLINAIKREYALEFNSLRSEADSVILLSADGKQITLDQLLKDNAGKVLYVDFWASWCVPCRRAMPASHDLKDLYTGKPVHFIYISIDRKFDDWALASKEEGLSDNTSNYLYLNAGSSKWAKEMKLNTIPRYVIFDMKGALSHRDAPGPDGVGAKEILDKYLD